MPRAGGIFSLVASYFARPGERIRTEQHNPVLEDIGVALTQSYPRDGSAPMTGNMPMGGNRITGLGEAIQPGDAVNFGQAAAAVSPGVITMFGGSSAPSGSLLCNGGGYNRNAYPGLFAVIGYLYGGSGDTFNVPNLQGRVPVGAGAGYGIGATGGEASVQLSEAQMPAHQHNGSTSTDGSHTHTPESGGRFITHGTGSSQGFNFGPVYNDTQSVPQTASSGSHFHNLTTDVRGSSQAHNNMQPYVVINYIIKT